MFSFHRQLVVVVNLAVYIYPITLAGKHINTVFIQRMRFVSKPSLLFQFKKKENRQRPITSCYWS